MGIFPGFQLLWGVYGIRVLTLDSPKSHVSNTSKILKFKNVFVISPAFSWHNTAPGIFTSLRQLKTNLTL